MILLLYSILYIAIMYSNRHSKFFQFNQNKLQYSFNYAITPIIYDNKLNIEIERSLSYLNFFALIY